MKNKIVAITGSHGFLGKALLKRLTDSDQSYMTHIIKREDFYLPGFKEKLREINPSLIIHCGAYGNHSDQTDDQETFEANVVKTFLLIKDTLDIPYEAFINIGSSSEYGIKIQSMREEDYLEPMTMYAGTKAAGTMIARVFAKKYNKPIVTVRPFSVYGPGEADHRFIPTAIKALVKGEELQLDPNAQHDWIYIDDFVEAVLKVIEHASVLSGNAVNIGMGKQYANREVLTILEMIAGKEAKVVNKNFPRTDSKYWIANNSLLKLCRWLPMADLKKGLMMTYGYYKEKYDQK